MAGRRVRCPRCRGEFELAPATSHESPPRATPPPVPSIGTIPVGSDTATPRPVGTYCRFNFACPRCESVLEAHSGQSGRSGRCPSCATTFLVPTFDPESQTVGPVHSVSGEPQDPTPVHAYAAAGAKAPEIVQTEGGEQAVQCPRCDQLSPIEANRCEECGLPFTMEGVSYDVVPGRTNGYAIASLAMGLLGLPCSVLVVPQVLAVIFGLVAMFQIQRNSLVRGQAFAIIGIAMGVFGLAITTAAFIMKA
jgi:hypothetical protein